MNPEDRPGWLERVLSLDRRSLVWFRIALGLFTTADVLHRLLDFRALYSDFGALPRSAVTGEYANRWHLSLHVASDAIWWELLLFAVCALAGLAMAIGYRTWISTLVAWVLVVSLQNRNEAAMDGGDMVQRLLLFWALFLPLGAMWSVDAVRGGAGAAITRARVFSPGSVALNIQMASIFFFAALLKTGDSWRKDFNAVWYVLNWDVYTTSIGVWLRQFHDLLRGFTIGTMILEGIFPLLLFVPWAPVRVFAILSLVSLHVGFVVVMKLFMFASVMILGWMSLMPAWFWEKLGVGFELREAWQTRLRWLSARLPGGAAAEGDSGSWSALERFPRAANWFATLCLIYVCCWNIRGVYPPFQRVFPQSANAFAFSLRLDQYWIMFAPTPVREDGWFVAPGRLADGQIVDVFRDGAPVSWERPPLVADTYINRRWRRFLWTVTRADAPGYRRYYASYLCRQWDSRHDEILESFDLVLMHEEAKPDYTVTPPDRMILLQGYKCH